MHILNPNNQIYFLFKLILDKNIEECRNMCFPPCSPLVPAGLPGGSDGKASACSAGNPGSIPGLGRSPGEGNGNPLQYSCLENFMD